MVPLEEAKHAYKKLLVSYDILCKEFNHPSPTSDILDKEYIKILLCIGIIKLAYMKEKNNNYNLRKIGFIVEESNFKESQVKKMNVLLKKMN